MQALDAESAADGVERRIWYSARELLMGYYQRFAGSEERWPDNIAVELQRSDPALPIERHTYAELRRMAESTGAWLSRLPLGGGARCALLGGNGPSWVAAYLGILAAGGIAVPLDTAFHADQVAKLLRNCEAALLFADARNLEHAKQAITGLSTRIVLLEKVAGAEFPVLDDMFAAGPADFRAIETPDDDVGVVLYTSGTTSDPKGVMLTHRNLQAEADGAFAFVRLTMTDSILGVLPLFHALAQMANLLLPFQVGARVVYLEALNTTDILRALRERKVTLFACVPQFFYLIHERITKEIQHRGPLARLLFPRLLKVSAAARKLGLNPGKKLFGKAHEALGSNMRYLVTGGSRFDPQIGRELHAMGFDILQGYGLTETSGAVVLTPPEHNVVGSVGRVLPQNEVKIVDPKPPDDGQGPASGEIAVRGPLVMKGYWNRPEATAEVIRDGWLHTGDLGFLDPQGDLFITGRAKEIIVLSNGKNIYPEEIEAYYLKSPYIKEICVLGLESRPGEPFNERLHAVIVPNFDLLKERKIVNASEVIRFDLDSISATLPSTKRILSYEFWQEELPRTTTRKLKRFEIKKRVEQGQGSGAFGDAPARQLTEEDQLWMGQPDVERALKVIRAAARKKSDRILPADNLELDLGLDSMERVELLVALERELGAHVEDSVVSEVYTVRELVEAVRSGMGAAAPRADAAGWEAILANDSDDPEVTRIARPHPILARLWFAFSRLLRVAFADLLHLEVSGAEKLPASGPCIISPNHQSFVDPVVLATALPYALFANSFSVGTSEIFGRGAMKYVGRALNVLPVDPDANLVPAMRAGAFGLKRGKVLVLFPEGERSIDGSPKKFKKGAAILAAHLNVPIYPVAIDGLQVVWPRGKGFQRFARVKLAIGDPVLPPETISNPEATYAQLTDELRSRVVEMWERLHGRAEAAAAD